MEYFLMFKIFFIAVVHIVFINAKEGNYYIWEGKENYYHSESTPQNHSESIISVISTTNQRICGSYLLLLVESNQISGVDQTNFLENDVTYNEIQFLHFQNGSTTNLMRFSVMRQANVFYATCIPNAKRMYNSFFL